MRNLPLTLSLAAVCFFVALNISLLMVLPQPISPVVAYFQEKFHVETAKTFAQFGLSHNAGLATLPREWVVENFAEGKFIQDPKQDYFTYTHYPSFTDLFTGAGAILFGTEKVYPLRIIPLLINSIFLWVFLRHALALFPQRGFQISFLVFFTLMAPMGWLSLHAISHYSYALYISLAFIGVMLPVFQSINPALMGRTKKIALLFGFLTGLFTFDYFFIALGTPLAVCCLFHGQDAFTQKPLRRLWLILGFWTGVGFTLAHTIHFMQVVAYYGSFTTAFQDIFGSALYRLTGNTEYYRFIPGFREPKEQEDCVSTYYCASIESLGSIKGRLQLLFDYITVWTSDGPTFAPSDIRPLTLMRGGVYLTIPIIAWGALGAAAVSLFRKKALTHYSVLFCLTLTLSSLWVLALSNHATRHVSIIPRHYYFCFILIALFVFRLFYSKTKDQRSHSLNAFKTMD